MSFDNKDITLLASAARTAETESDEQTNTRGKGLHVIIDVTVDPATASITPKIQGKDPASGKWYDILVGIAITATGMTVLKVYPGIVAVANAAASDILPAHWRFQMAVADTDSMTYSVGALVIN
ncbi:hypothetical protein LCGC14_0448610 [marine sediment metagenome]|uniref:Uncharacterized protein n=1 Tax=marine sediment metagenome TaxID=412755 RepID=A0A0F9SI95_9ZZZZ